MIDYETAQSLVGIIAICLIANAAVFVMISAVTDKVIHPAWQIVTVALTVLTTAVITNDLLARGVKLDGIEGIAAVAGIWVALNTITKNAWKSINTYKKD